ncbi:dnaJ-like protein subfamily C member 5 [Platysternon megacephalum]|uniref:DnaJ-like protein subfamily C member 5 n=1 Tax=Platysternon megacephalum TaxID=55544 RepID=A0A4D9E5E8_9SAUR|nr:dnaJ-like protein subfamily C member 5 [Platysternon megacephalum]
MKWKFLHSSALWNLTPLETCGPMVQPLIFGTYCEYSTNLFLLSVTPSSYCHIHRVINLLKHEKAWMSELAKIYIVQYSLEKHFWHVKGGEKQRGHHPCKQSRR